MQGLDCADRLFQNPSHFGLFEKSDSHQFGGEPGPRIHSNSHIQSKIRVLQKFTLWDLKAWIALIIVVSPYTKESILGVTPRGTVHLRKGHLDRAATGN
jgi:hypothetical protein